MQRQKRPYAEWEMERSPVGCRREGKAIFIVQSLVGDERDPPRQGRTVSNQYSFKEFMPQQLQQKNEDHRRGGLGGGLCTRYAVSFPRLTIAMKQIEKERECARESDRVRAS